MPPLTDRSRPAAGASRADRFALRRAAVAALVSLGALAEPAVAQGPAPDSSAPAADVYTAVQRAQAAERAGDAAGYLRHVERVAQLAPDHPAAHLYMARARALTGNPAGAVAALEALAPLGAATDLAADSAFRALRGTPAFERVVSTLAANAGPLVRSDTAFALADPDLVPESVAYDPQYQTFYAGSLAKYKIVRVGPSGATTDFVTLGPEGAGRVVGIKVDPVRRRLWAATYAFDSTAAASRTGERLRAALDVFDLATGKQLRRYEPTDQLTVAHFFNDVALDPDGGVYLTDQGNDAVLRVRAGRGGALGDSLERVSLGEERRFTYPNGLDVSPDGRRLYVAHVEGISVLDLARGGPARTLDHPVGATTASIDGLYACMRSLVVIQRVVGFDQVTRLKLDASGQRATGVEALERRHPAYESPTTGVVVRDALYYIPNSQVGRLAGAREPLRPAASPHPSVVLKLPIGERCR